MKFLGQLTRLILLTFALGISANATDHVCTTAAELTTAITAAVGGDTITLTAGNVFVGPFTLKAGLLSEVVIRSSAHASMPAVGTRITSSHYSLMPIIRTGTFTNDVAIQTVDNADNWTLFGLKIEDNPAQTSTSTLVNLGDDTEGVAANQPDNIIISHCYIHATLGNKARRGIGANTQTFTLRDSVVEDFRVDGFEAQAIAVWNGPGPHTITNNYLSAIGENVIIGGATWQTAEMVAHDLVFTRNSSEAKEKYNPWNYDAFDMTDGAAVTYNLACGLSSSGTIATCTGHGAPIGVRGVLQITSGPQAGEKRTAEPATVNTFSLLMGGFSATQSVVTAKFVKAFPFKNNFELKAMDGATIQGNVFKGAWPYAQAGMSILFTIRNDTGLSPFVVLEDINFSYNIIKDVFGGINILVNDNLQVSGVAERITIEHNLMTNYHHIAIPPAGSPRVWQLLNGHEAPEPDDIFIRHNTSISERPDLGVMVVLSGPEGGNFNNFDFKDNLTLFGEYGMFADTFGPGGNISKTNYAPDAEITGNVFITSLYSQAYVDANYPAGNLVASSFASVGFSNLAAGIYSLDSSSAFKNTASDGTDPGVNWNALVGFTYGAEAGNWSAVTRRYGGGMKLGGGRRL